MLILARADARKLPLRDASVQCCVTSPPYWGLRDYGTPGQLGLEPTPEEYVEHMAEVFREVKRGLRSDGTLWLNLGDSYASSPASGGRSTSSAFHGSPSSDCDHHTPRRKYVRPAVLKPKDLCGVPWRVALALQADGWYLRSDIIWAKPNPMPESVADRPTKAHEYLFLFAKSASYYYDADAVREPHTMRPQRRKVRLPRPSDRSGDNGFASFVRDEPGVDGHPLGRNCRSVWMIATAPYPGAHYATFPEALVEPCIRAGSREGDVVLDPFAGTATVGRVAIRLKRRAVCLDISDHYLRDLAARRTRNVQMELVA